MSVHINRLVFVIIRLCLLSLVYVARFLRRAFDEAILNACKNRQCFGGYHTAVLLACLTFFVFSIFLNSSRPTRDALENIVKLVANNENIKDSSLNFE